MVGEAKHEVTGKGTHKIYQPTQKKIRKRPKTIHRRTVS